MRFRLISLLIVFLALVLGLSSFVLYYSIKANLIEGIELRISNLADDIVVEIAENPALFQKAPARFIVPSKSNELIASRLLVQFMDKDGNLLARSPGLVHNLLPFTKDEDDILKDIELEDRTRFKFYQRKIEVEGRDFGYVIVGSPISYIYSVLDNLRNVLIIIGAGILIILGFGVNAFTSMAVIERQRKFLSFASHELRTPLSVISGTAEVALRGPLPDEHKKTLNAIKEESDWLNKLVSDFLFISRNEMGKEKLNKTKFNLGDLLAEAASAVKQRYPQKEFTINLSPEAEIKADHDRLKLVVNNLLENAAKYTEENGKINITLTALPNQFMVEVADNGVGIEKKLQKKIFDPFYRIEQKDNVGMGLGLAITKWIVDAHGGNIQVRSEKSQGSTITVYLSRG